MSQYERIDNDEDALEFDVSKIEQMQVEFKICTHCGGSGFRNNGIYTFTCPVCHGAGEVEKEVRK